MSDHFAAFSFVDRITELEPGVRARGTFAVPETLARFPACLVAEAVGQLAAWVAMAQIDFRGRPVAALANETIFHGDVAPGSQLELSVEIEALDEDAVAYGGFARVDGTQAIELRHCLGPMLPVPEFDAPDALRERFRLLCATGAPAGRFRGVATPELIALEAAPPNRRVRCFRFRGPRRSLPITFRGDRCFRQRCFSTARSDWRWTSRVRRSVPRARPRSCRSA